MDAIALKMSYRDVPFDADDRRVMCFAHVVDLSSGRVIRKAEGKKEKKKINDSDEAIADVTPSPTNPIDVARSVVRVIRASRTRQDGFGEVITDGNAKSWFKQGDPPKVVSLERL